MEGLQVLLVGMMVLDLGERKTTLKRKKYQIIKHKKPRFMQRYSRDSNKETHGELVDDAHTCTYTLAIILFVVRHSGESSELTVHIHCAYYCLSVVHTMYEMLCFIDHAPGTLLT